MGFRDLGFWIEVLRKISGERSSLLCALWLFGAQLGENMFPHLAPLCAAWPLQKIAVEKLCPCCDVWLSGSVEA